MAVLPWRKLTEIERHAVHAKKRLKEQAAQKQRKKEDTLHKAMLTMVDTA